MESNELKETVLRLIYECSAIASRNGMYDSARELAMNGRTIELNWV